MAQTPALPIVCSLTPEAIGARKAELLPGLFRRAVSTESLPNGVCLQFGASTEAIQAIVATIEAERQCCRFLRFDLTVEPDGGPIRLTLTGSDGTAEFLTALVQE
jgi:hypothetical protein